MKIATYNVNGIQARLPALLSWLKESQPDVACLQELKAGAISGRRDTRRRLRRDLARPEELERRGDTRPRSRARRAASRAPGGSADLHSRYLEALVGDIVVGCLYLPNGNPAPGPRFDYKLQWLDRLLRHGAELLASNAPVALVGDYNVIPTDLDVYAPERWVDDALFRPEVRDAYRRLLAQGWLDAVRTVHPGKRVYTFWKYLRNAFARDAGLRIDHFLLSPPLAVRLSDAGVDRDVRARAKASDHAPAWIVLAD